MTICIAAMADNSTKLVLVTDQMITFNVPMPYQYETEDVAKSHDLAPNVVALTAGSAQAAYDITIAARKRIEAEQPSTFDEVAEFLRLEYQAYRRRIIIQNVLEPRGLDLAAYYQNQQILLSALVQDIDGSLRNFDLGVEMLVAGHDEDACHINSLHNPGTVISHDSIGFACVGIGAPHAVYYLIGADYKKNLSCERVEKLVRKAKAMSEKAPGVGSETVVFHLPKGESHARPA